MSAVTAMGYALCLNGPKACFAMVGQDKGTLSAMALLLQKHHRLWASWLFEPILQLFESRSALTHDSIVLNHRINLSFD